ncbi:MAG: cystathionine beta-lyase [Gammaproteobacteria bacterium]|nr:MAG: cystathionine beta-lyase [Gammaproteobacteria bacterium]
MHQNTLCVHAGTRNDRGEGVNNPIEPSAPFAYLDAKEPIYPRYFNTPGQDALVERLCALEHAADGLLFSSGMAAISTALFSLLQQGDHAVLQRDIYGGTQHLVTSQFERLGIAYDLVPATSEAFAAAIRPETRVLYIETPSNPLLRITDIAAAATLAREHGLVSIIDNTFASPMNQNPIDLGIDLVVHSGTKYLGGHSDLCCGVALGSHKLIERLLATARTLGGSVNPLTCYLLERSLKTLALRIERQNSNAQQLAERLRNLPGIACVHYPGLPEHPDHDVARRQMRGFGGMIAFELADDAPDTSRFQRHLRLIKPAISLGGVDTLICAPGLTSHRDLTPKERAEQGISERLLRLSVGIEAPDDLFYDLEQAVKEPLPEIL